jgi:hypothetical protein
VRILRFGKEEITLMKSLFFLVDSRGIIQKHHIGYQPPHVLTEDIEELLKNK